MLERVYYYLRHVEWVRRCEHDEDREVGAKTFLFAKHKV